LAFHHFFHLPIHHSLIKQPTTPLKKFLQKKIGLPLFAPLQESSIGKKNLIFLGKSKLQIFRVKQHVEDKKKRLFSFLCHFACTKFHLLRRAQMRTMAATISDFLLLFHCISTNI
jgi:hypothetical protein